MNHNRPGTAEEREKEYRDLLQYILPNLKNRGEPGQSCASDALLVKQIEWTLSDEGLLQGIEIPRSIQESVLKRLGLEDLEGAPVAFGLQAQGKIEQVTQLLEDGKNWDEIGEAIGWDGQTAKKHYNLYKENK